MNKIVECIPNFSEGKDKSAIQRIVAEIEKTEDVMLLDVDSGTDANRTVVTFLGTPESITNGAFRAIQKASELIDMRKQKGVHPRLGSTDVCPFVPISGVTMNDCVKIAQDVGKRVGTMLNIPVYLYEATAQNPERKDLSQIRKGQYEGLFKKLSNPKWKPDYGPEHFNQKSGATAIGARKILIAYNVNLNTQNLRLAQKIALNLRESGRIKRDKNGQIVFGENRKPERISGRLKAVKGIGWYIEEYGIAQVSYNVTNFKVTPIHIVFEETCKEAANLGIDVTGSELIGMIPLQAMLESGKYFQRKQGRSENVSEKELIETAVESMGLDNLKPFDPEKKIIEYCIHAQNKEQVGNSFVKLVNEVLTLNDGMFRF